MLVPFSCAWLTNISYCLHFPTVLREQYRTRDELNGFEYGVCVKVCLVCVSAGEANFITLVRLVLLCWIFIVPGEHLNTLCSSTDIHMSGVY